MKPPKPRRTSILKLFFIAATLLLVVAPNVNAEDAPGYRLPRFRRVPGQIRIAPLPAGTALRLLADEDFPPYSFRTRSGAAAGLAVELAMAACAKLKIACEVGLLPLPGLLPALANGQGDVIVAGPRIDAQALVQTEVTRPWFRSLGRFAAQSGSPIGASDTRTLAGKRIGAVKGTSHAAWLATYYSDSKLIGFDSEEQAQDALRTGNVEALFGDDLRQIFWVSGAASRGCCKLLGGAYSDFDSFSRSYAFLMAAGRGDLREAFDQALDQMQEDGTTEKIFNIYVPLNPW